MWANQLAHKPLITVALIAYFAIRLIQVVLRTYWKKQLFRITLNISINLFDVNGFALNMSLFLN